jgi:hypothetical protein
MNQCCARMKAKLAAAEGDLKRNAIRAASAEQKGHPMGRWKLRIANDKEAVRRAKQAIIDHDAEHADDADRG